MAEELTLCGKLSHHPAWSATSNASTMRPVFTRLEGNAHDTDVRVLLRCRCLVSAVTDGDLNQLSFSFRFPKVRISVRIVV
jgi:hypothetical protein